MSETFEMVKNVTAELLKIDAGTITPESRFVEDLGADSMQSVELVAAIEEAFDIEMSESAALEVKTVGSAADFVDECLDD